MKIIATLLLAGLALALGGCTSTPVYGPEGGEFSGPAAQGQSATSAPAK